MRRFMPWVLAVASLGFGFAVGVTLSGGKSGPGWVIRDLGTLGGAASGAVAINERGQVVGWAETRTRAAYNSEQARGEEDGRTVHGFVWENGELRDLGLSSCAGGDADSNKSEAVAINDNGQVVGQSSFSAYQWNGSGPCAFLWEDGALTALSTHGVPIEMALGPPAINSHGDVVYTDDEIRARVFRKGISTLLARVPGHRYSVPVAINDAGQVVGNVYPRRFDEFGMNESVYHPRAVLWTKGSTVTVDGLPGAASSEAVAITSDGQVVGTSYAGSITDRSQAFLWEDGVPTGLGVLPGDSDSFATAANDRGWVIGVSYASLDAGGTPRRAFVWHDGRLTDLGALPDAASSTAVAINENGVIVGSGCGASSEECEAFVWADGEMTGLGTLPGGTTSAATAINDDSQIVGWATTSTGDRHAVLWTPKQSPAFDRHSRR